jgi:hypothetical protein
MHLKKPSAWKHSGDRPVAVRTQQDNPTHHASASMPLGNSHSSEIDAAPRSLAADVLFFVDHAISVTVASVARKQAQKARLMVTGKSGTNLHVSVGTTGEGDSCHYVAYNNDMCLFVGSSPSLYVVNQTARELEHSIYLFISERLSGEPSVSAQIFRETGTMFELPILEGSSDLGPRSLKPRQNVLPED